jgi:hypothetical protein
LTSNCSRSPSGLFRQFRTRISRLALRSVNWQRLRSLRQASMAGLSAAKRRLGSNNCSYFPATSARITKYEFTGWARSGLAALRQQVRSESAPRLRPRMTSASPIMTFVHAAAKGMLRVRRASPKQTFKLAQLTQTMLHPASRSAKRRKHHLQSLGSVIRATVLRCTSDRRSRPSPQEQPELFHPSASQ